MSAPRLRPPIGLGAFAVAAAACIVASTVAIGGKGALSAAVGALIVLVFFGSTRVVLAPVVGAVPWLSLVAAVMFYATKVVALLALFTLLAEASGGERPFNARALALTVIVTTFTWIAGHVFDDTHSRAPIYDLPDTTKMQADRFDPQ